MEQQEHSQAVLLPALQVLSHYRLIRIPHLYIDSPTVLQVDLVSFRWKLTKSIVDTIIKIGNIYSNPLLYSLTSLSSLGK